MDLYAYTAKNNIIASLEAQEKPLLEKSQREVADRLHDEEIEMLNDAKQEIVHSSHDAATGAKLRKQAFEVQLAIHEFQMAARRNISQIMTRVSVIRDLMVKQLIKSLITNQQPLRFETSTFTIYVGKTTNMSSVHPSFNFPPKFVVPPDSPDEPTLENPVTGFSFEYLEYKQNIYSWAVSSPPSSESLVATLIVYWANTMDLFIDNEPEPIRLFANRDTPASGICMMWDRFAPDTAGGAWSTRGIINDGQGCLATQVGDFGIFLDGRLPSVF